MRTCKSCRYYYVEKCIDAAYCYRYPPTIQGRLGDDIAEFPKLSTSLDDREWCGEWCAKEGAVQNITAGLTSVSANAGMDAVSLCQELVSQFDEHSTGVPKYLRRIIEKARGRLVDVTGLDGRCGGACVEHDQCGDNSHGKPA